MLWTNYRNFKKKYLYNLQRIYFIVLNTFISIIFDFEIKNFNKSLDQNFFNNRKRSTQIIVLYAHKIRQKYFRMGKVVLVFTEFHDYVIKRKVMYFSHYKYKEYLKSKT